MLNINIKRTAVTIVWIINCRDFINSIFKIIFNGRVNNYK